MASQALNNDGRTLSVGNDADFVVEAGPDVTVTGFLPVGYSVSTGSVDSASLPELPDGYSHYGQPLSVELDGPEPHQVYLDLNFRVPVESSDLVVGHLLDTGSWEIYRPEEVDGSIRWSTGDFSIFEVLQEKATGGLRKVESFADSIADSLTGASDVPENCDLQGSQGVQWASHTGSPGVGLVHVCGRNRSDGRFEIVFKSNSSAPVEVNVPNQSDVDWIWQEGTGDYASKVLSAGLSNPNSRLLAPGRQMTIGWSRPEATPGPFDFWFSQTPEAIMLAYLADSIGTNLEGIAALMVLCVGLDSDDVFLTGQLSPLEVLKRCGQSNVLDQLYKSGVDALTEGAFRQSMQLAAQRFQRRPEMVTANLNAAEEFLTRNRVFSARSIGRIALLADLSIDLVSLGPLGLSSAFGADDAFKSSVFLNGYCAQQGPVLDGTVIGVDTSLTLRASPSTSAAELAQLPRDSKIRFFPGSSTDREGRNWTTVMHPDGMSCGSVASEYIGRPAAAGEPNPSDPQAIVQAFVAAVNNNDAEALERLVPARALEDFSGGWSNANNVALEVRPEGACGPALEAGEGKLDCYVHLADHSIPVVFLLILKPADSGFAIEDIIFLHTT